jgi:hypothetical protein
LGYAPELFQVPLISQWACFDRPRPFSFGTILNHSLKRREWVFPSLTELQFDDVVAIAVFGLPVHSSTPVLVNHGAHLLAAATTLHRN